jgi:hypothetical protein
MKKSDLLSEFRKVFTINNDHMIIVDTKIPLDHINLKEKSARNKLIKNSFFDVFMSYEIHGKYKKGEYNIYETYNGAYFHIEFSLNNFIFKTPRLDNNNTGKLLKEDLEKSLDKFKKIAMEHYWLKYRNNVLLKKIIGRLFMLPAYIFWRNIDFDAYKDYYCLEPNIKDQI